MPAQPALHDLVTVVRAPSVALSGPDGQLRGHGAHGWFQHDRRLLSVLAIDLLGAELTPVGGRLAGVSGARFDAVVIGAQPGLADPTVRLRRDRVLTGEQLTDRFELSNSGLNPVEYQVELRLATDHAPVALVKDGGVADLVPGDLATLTWPEVTVAVDPPARTRDEFGVAVLTWPVRLAANESWQLTVTARGHVEPAGFTPTAAPSPGWRLPGAPADQQCAAVLDRNLADLDALLLADPVRPADRFAAAGSPWFLTLFGRDSLLTAWLLLPLGTELAGGTLRALARRQGRTTDPHTEEQPGRILHEVRRGELRTSGLHLPPVYYGTIDATALWVRLLHDAWRAGLPEDEVRALLPNLRAAMEWITGPADADGDGLLEYGGSGEGGLANQGWKDSGDSIRFADGAFAKRPLALCEVQGYAHAAALGAAVLARAFDEPGAEQWWSWAAALRERFRARFWISDEIGPYPAIALDADKTPVTGASSNMAHLLGTGLLDTDEAARVAHRLSQPDLDCGRGLRTLSAASAAYNPYSYHCGTVWPHDTAVAIRGLAAEGHRQLADDLARGLLEAAHRFGNRLPELYAADPEVLAYPAACRPQAWAAAAAVTAVGQLSDWW
ncbi:glycogen debranching N-terminal domain-containing protein [Kutzneria viridogrisea]|uniref:Amylo-alpha-1,6-glucosidase n=2 Tax=Kutzneria TaxID=43356 RepID=W5WFQ4_9PSEU|nr:glycogen debranching N-terminal domain-containing protein [Kutzneria albida]AHH99436.1 hypothetical protein KALB_6076 [Kutzneria albida DSM 43870]MBA8923007.1 hypothetical protein [Kutzneria viridogrisea]